MIPAPWLVIMEIRSPEAGWVVGSGRERVVGTLVEVEVDDVVREEVPDLADGEVRI